MFGSNKSLNESEVVPVRDLNVKTAKFDQLSGGKKTEANIPISIPSFQNFIHNETEIDIAEEELMKL